MTEPMRLFMGCTAYRTIEAGTAGSMLGAVLNGGDASGYRIVSGGVLVGYGAPRNWELMVGHVIESGAECLLSVEHDMGFQPDSVSKIVALYRAVCQANPGFNVIGARYPRQWDGKVLVGDPDPTSKNNVWTGIEGNPAALCAFRAVYCGLGFTLIPVALLEAMRHPIAPETFKSLNYFETLDVGFCRNARQSGATIWCSDDLGVRHGIMQFVGI